MLSTNPWRAEKRVKIPRRIPQYHVVPEQTVEHLIQVANTEGVYRVWCSVIVDALFYISDLDEDWLESLFAEAQRIYDPRRCVTILRSAYLRHEVAPGWAKLYDFTYERLVYFAGKHEADRLLRGLSHARSKL